jgi:pimeloyl-ACP methyl ester carboxylesterase
MVNELRTALDEARIPGPFVVVGHSLGGLVVRVFADRYASDIAGVVLIDSMNSSEAASPAADTPAAASSDPLGDWIITSPARIGVLRLLAGPLDLQADLSPEVAPVYVAYSVTPRFVQTTVAESRGLPESLAQAGAVTSLGSVPLTVLTRGVKADETWQRQQTELLKLSSNSQQIIASMSGHNIQLDQPQAAVDAVMKMVESVRGHTPVTQRL